MFFLSYSMLLVPVGLNPFMLLKMGLWCEFYFQVFDLLLSGDYLFTLIFIALLAIFAKKPQTFLYHPSSMTTTLPCVLTYFMCITSPSNLHIWSAGQLLILHDNFCVHLILLFVHPHRPFTPLLPYMSSKCSQRIMAAPLADPWLLRTIRVRSSSYPSMAVFDSTSVAYRCLSAHNDVFVVLLNTLRQNDFTFPRI